MSDAAIRVFISYSHDSDEHKAQVLELADRLRSDGLDVKLDQFEVDVPPRWMVQQIEDAKFVLVVCTETYKKRFEGKQERGGLGADFEGKTITQLIYQRRQGFAVPILFGGSSSFIPTVLRDVTYYRLPDGYDDLYRRLTDQHATPRGPIGQIRKMAPAPRPGMRGVFPSSGKTGATDSPKALPSKPQTQASEAEDSRTKDALEAYKAWAFPHHDQLQMIGLDAGDVRVSLDEIYVPLRLMGRGGLLGRGGLMGLGPDEDFGDLHGLRHGQTELGADEVLGIAGERHVLIFGEPGSGKTTALKKLHQLCARDPVALGLDAQTVPVFLRLRHLDQKLLNEEDLAAVIDREIESVSGLPDCGQALWAHRRLLLLFDGLDEIPDSAKRERVLQRILWFCRQVDGVRAVVSCRRVALPGAEADRDRDFETFEVRPLQDDQIHQLVKLWFGEMARAGKIPETQAADRVAMLREALAASSLSSRNMLELVSNPLLLTLLCVVVLLGGEIPRERILFYEKCLEVLLKRWPNVKGCPGPLDLKTSIRALARIAFFLHLRGRRDDLVWPEALGQLHAEFSELQAADSFLGWAVDNAGILIASDDRHYGFVHLGIQEYLTGIYLLADTDRFRELPDDLDVEWWQEVFLQLAAVAERQGFVRLTSHLLQNPKIWQEHAELLRACLAEAKFPDLGAFEACLQKTTNTDRISAVLRLLWPVRESFSDSMIQAITSLEHHELESIQSQARQLLTSRDDHSSQPDRICVLYESERHVALGERLVDRLRNKSGGCDPTLHTNSSRQATTAPSRCSLALMLLGPEESWSGWKALIPIYPNLTWLVLRMPSDPAPEIPEELKGLEVWDWQPGQEEHMAGRILDRLVTSSSMSASFSVAGAPTVSKGLRAGRSSESFVEPITGETFIWVPAGEFRMGSELWEHTQPCHQVKISEFWLAKTPITNREYAMFLKDSNHEAPPTWRGRRFNDPNQPVVGVSWHDAQLYCQWLTDRSEDSLIFSLPSEAQWEYAARGPENRTYPWGEEEPCNELAWFGQDYSTDEPAPVGSFPKGAGPFKHLDLAGNVLEWCADCWNGDYSQRFDGIVDPIGQGDKNQRPLRGGAWDESAPYLHPTFRYWFAAGELTDNLGFRVSCAPSNANRP